MKVINKFITIVMFTLIIIGFKAPCIVKASDSITSYTMDLDFNEKSNTIKGMESVKFTNNYDEALKNIVMHLYADSYNKAETLPAIGKSKYAHQVLSKEEMGDIRVNSVTISNKKVSYTQDNQILNIKLNNHLLKGQSVEIKVNFTLKIPKGFNRLGYNEGQYSLTNWYPIMSIYDVKNSKWDENEFNPIGESNYSDIANYDVTLRVPKGMVVAATGVNQSIKSTSNTDIVNIKAENVRDFTIMMSKNYRVLSSTVDGVKINSYYLYNGNKDKNEETARALMNYGKEALEFFGETFGKYPYPEIDIVESYLNGGAMEYPQLVQMGRYPKSRIGWLREAVVHEIGHQWWYVTVGSNEFKEPFLDEALTQYSTSYFFKKKYQENDMNLVMLRITLGLNKVDKPINRSVDKFNDWNDYGVTIYGRGSLVFDNLKNEVGDEKFQKILSTYFNRYKFKNSSVNSLLDVIKEVAGDSVSDGVKKAIN